MLTNKVTLELDIPLPESEEEAQELERILALQTNALILDWRKRLASYRADYGVEVPQVSVRLPTKFKAEKAVDPNKVVIDELVEYHIKFNPLARGYDQRAPIKQLLEAGFTKEQLTSAYNSSRKEYILTSWFTVRSKISKPVSEESTEHFSRKELNSDELSDLKLRLKNGIL